jgi:hypothetical protein
MVEAELPGSCARCARARPPRGARRRKRRSPRTTPGSELWASIHLVGALRWHRSPSYALADFEKQWRLNTVTCFLTCREAVKAIRKDRPRRADRCWCRRRHAGVRRSESQRRGDRAIARGGSQRERILINAVCRRSSTHRNRAAMPTADHASWAKPRRESADHRVLASSQNARTSGNLVA